MKVLVTGASGLLGTDICLDFERNDISVIKSSFSNRAGFISADIRTEDGIKKLANLNWDCIVHTSATRDPDICEKNRDEAYLMNIRAVELLANEAKKRHAKFVFISTDYVFDGNNPPYKECDVPKPINYYGETKLQGENIVLNECENSIVIRVPILFGLSAGLKASALLYSSIQAFNSIKETYIDDAIIRHPTYTKDVANALSFLLNCNKSGVFHFSSHDSLTKYQMTLIIAKALNKSFSHILPLKTILKTPAKRPIDSKLDCSKIFSLGLENPLTFEQRIKSIKHSLA